MGILTKDAIFGTDDLVIEKVDLEEFWGGHVFVKTLTGLGRDEYEMSVMASRGEDNEINIQSARIDLVVLTTCDSDRNLLFEKEDVERLNQKNAKAINKIFAVAQRLNGLRKEDIEELAKN